MFAQDLKLYKLKLTLNFTNIDGFLQELNL